MVSTPSEAQGKITSLVQGGKIKGTFYLLFRDSWFHVQADGNTTSSDGLPRLTSSNLEKELSDILNKNPAGIAFDSELVLGILKEKGNVSYDIRGKPLALIAGEKEYTLLYLG